MRRMSRLSARHGRAQEKWIAQSERQVDARPVGCKEDPAGWNPLAEPEQLVPIRPIRRGPTSGKIDDQGMVTISRSDQGASEAENSEPRDPEKGAPPAACAVERRDQKNDPRHRNRKAPEPTQPHGDFEQECDSDEPGQQARWLPFCAVLGSLLPAKNCRERVAGGHDRADEQIRREPSQGPASRGLRKPEAGCEWRSPHAMPYVGKEDRPEVCGTRIHEEVPAGRK